MFDKEDVTMLDVYIGYQCVYNGADCWRSVFSVFLNEKKAIKWVSEFEATEWAWREYEKESAK